MTILERQVQRAQRQLWVNRGLERFAWCMAGAIGAFALLVLVQRLWGLALPVWWGALTFGVAALSVSLWWTAMTRDSIQRAAVALDDAANLRERISTGMYCRQVSDPFAQAVVDDAERVGGSLTVRVHLPVRIPRTFGHCAALMILSALLFLITPGVLRRDQAKATTGVADQVQQQARVVVKERLAALPETLSEVPTLKDLKSELQRMGNEPLTRTDAPGDVRHEALKTVDRMSELVRQRRADSKYESTEELRRMMRGLQIPRETNDPTQKLTQALSRSDFQTAREEIKALQEQLATLKSEQDKELAERLGKQLAELAKQLDKVSRNEELAQKLQQAGVKKEDLERMLERLTKKDIEDLQKKLQDSGMNQQQISKLAEKLQQCQQAGSQAQQLANAMKQAAQGAGGGQMGEAIDGLSTANEQLDSLEQLQQEMQQLDSTLSGLQGERDQMEKSCSTCNGTGQSGGKACGQCGGSGMQPGKGGMGQRMGRGTGGLAPEEQTAVAFKTERTPVHTGKGAIIGQFQVDGEQLKGDVTTEFVEVVTAAERVASDAVDRDRVPRQYQRSIKEYFSSVRRFGAPPKRGQPADGDAEKKPSDEAPDDKSEKPSGSSSGGEP